MSTQAVKNVRLTFPAGQYMLYAVIGFVLWTMGVILVRVLGPTFFEGGLLLAVLYGASLVIGVVTQVVVQKLIRQPMKDTLIAVVFICGFALVLDGLAIGFTNIYSSDPVMKTGAGGWLLWTFGTQLLITLLFVNRASNS